MMKPLTQLLKSIKPQEILGDVECNVTDIVFDSRRVAAMVAEGGLPLYVAQRGTQTDGHRFIPQVVEAGGRVIVCEELPE